MILQRPMSLYVHIPWCVKKCPYCDFNSHVQNGDSRVDIAYQSALYNHLDAWLPWIENRPITSIFFGGGTPSLMAPDWYHDVIARFSDVCMLSDYCEITMEVNPGATEYGLFSDYRSAGINRLSFGVQSFQPKYLEVLGRIHSAHEASEAISRAASAGFERINVDLMYGLPNQSVSHALADLNRALTFPVSHISWYNLTIEQNTVFYSNPPKGLPDDLAIYEQELRGRCLLDEHGLERYEVSAYAKRGQECQHNMGYWRYQDYIGIGAGAHGKVSDPLSGSIYRFQATRVPEHYMGHWGERCDLQPTSQVLKPDRPGEFMMNALRMPSGFSAKEFEATTFMGFNEISLIIENLIKSNLLIKADDRYVTTEKGYNHLDTVVAAFL